MKKKIFLTTSIPYVNSSPHVGHALEYVQADILARFYRQRGASVFFLTGADENAQKNLEASRQAGVKIRDFVEKNTLRFKKMLRMLNISYDDFIRTSQEERHRAGAQKLWRACRPNDIYKKKYQGFYCLGCEEFKTAKELNNGWCSEHPNQTPKIIKEENYFFRLSAYQGQIEDLINSNKLKIVPQTRRNEVLQFVRSGLEDFSISRQKSASSGWGIEVPGDSSQVMYVWFDALSNYINALGYAKNSPDFQNYWMQANEIIHIIGKGIIRFHAIYWVAILLSAGLPLPNTIFVHGYFTVNGKKISKSAGNSIDPLNFVKLGADPLRYYLIKSLPLGRDGDFSASRFRQAYRVKLANELGNLLNRVIALVKQNQLTISPSRQVKTCRIYEKHLANFNFTKALERVWYFVEGANKKIDQDKPWELTGKRAKNSIQALYRQLERINYLLKPFLPETSDKIANQLATLKPKVLFPRQK